MFGRDDDLQPCDMLSMVDKGLLCTEPPCSASYSSIGYVLLGFIAQSLRNQSRWTDWNRESQLPFLFSVLWQFVCPIDKSTGDCHTQNLM